MNTTKVKKDELLAKLKENRDHHKSEFEKAKATWKKRAAKALAKAAKKAADDGVIDMMPLRDLPKPKHYLDSYDLQIARLEYEVEDVVELTDREFQAWVLDDWDWQGAFAAGTSLYNAAP